MNRPCFWSICLLFTIVPASKFVASTCQGGQQYECGRKVEAACLKGCNATVSEALSPGSCAKNCCSVCYSDCRVCSYDVMVSLLVVNMDWTPEFAVSRSPAFTELERDIQASFHKAFDASGLPKLHVHLLEVAPAPYGIEILISIKSSNITTKQRVLNILSQYQKKENIGSFQVEADSLVVVGEDSSTAPPHMEDPARVDVVELCIASLAAVIILSAVFLLLYYLCTTPSQRARQCRVCRRNQIQ